MSTVPLQHLMVKDALKKFLCHKHQGGGGHKYQDTKKINTEQVNLKNSTAWLKYTDLGSMRSWFITKSH